MLERATAYGTVAPAMAAGYLGAVRGEVGGALAVAALGAVMLAVRLRLAGALPSLSRGRGLARVASVGAVAVLLVGASMTGALGPASSTTTASAALTANNCGYGDRVMSLFFSDYQYESGCVKQSTLETVKNISDNQTALDIYSAASTNAQVWESTRRVRMNYLTDMQTVAFSKGQAAAFAAYQNETDVNGDGNFTEADYKMAGRQAVEDFIAQKQENYLERWETQMVTTVELIKRVQNESGIANDFIAPKFYLSDGTTNTVTPATTLQNHTVTLANGSSYQLKALRQSFVPQYPISSSSGSVDSASFRVQSVNGQGVIEYLNSSKAADVTAKFDTVATTSGDNVAKWANGTYEALESGEINASTALTAATLAQEYATSYNGSGYYAYSTAALASAGLRTPNLNQTASMSIRYSFNRTINGTTYTNETVLTGLLLSQNAPPSGVWKNGTTYDPRALEGGQLFASQEWGVKNLSSNFTVTSIQTKDGTQVQNTTVQRYSYQTVNNSAYLELQEDLTALRMEMEQRESNLGGGGGGSGGSLPPWAVGGGLLAAVAVVALMMNQNNGGGRRAR